MSLIDLVTQQLGSGGVQQLSQQIGADEQQTAGAIQMALPVLLGGLAKNAQSPQGAQSLSGALDQHAGGLLGGLGGLLGGGAAADGAGILGHVLGGRQPAVEQGIGKAAGLDSAQVGKLLMMLAPVVMAVLARRKQEQGLDAGSIGGALNQERAELQEKNPQLGGLASILDRDNDGSIMDDLVNIAGGRGGAGGGLGGMLGGLLGGR
jgi:hypothetical protein